MLGLFCVWNCALSGSSLMKPTTAGPYRDILAHLPNMYRLAPVSFKVGDVTYEKGNNTELAQMLSFGLIYKLPMEVMDQLVLDFHNSLSDETPDYVRSSCWEFIINGWPAVRFPEGLAVQKSLYKPYVAFGPDAF